MKESCVAHATVCIQSTTDKIQRKRTSRWKRTALSTCRSASPGAHDEVFQPDFPGEYYTRVNTLVMVTMIAFTLALSPPSSLFYYSRAVACREIKLAKSTGDIACQTAHDEVCPGRLTKERRSMSIDHALHQIHIVVAHTSVNKKEASRRQSPMIDGGDFASLWLNSRGIMCARARSCRAGVPLRGLRSMQTIEKKQKRKKNEVDSNGTITRK